MVKTAIPEFYYDDQGYLQTVYLDPDTLQQISDLGGYSVLGPDGQYYEVTEDADEDGDGSIDPLETTSYVQRLKGDHTTAQDANPDAGKGTMNTNAADNYGYQSKPGFVGPAATAIGMFNPALGMAAKVGSAAWNANNASAVASARQMLGLPDQVGVKGFTDAIKGVMKDNKGQIADVSINNKDYSVGFEALSPTGKTNLTPMEARNRGLTLGGITEKSKPQSKLEKAMFEDDPVSPEESAPSKSKSRMSQITGIEPGVLSRALEKTGLKPGFMTKALDKVFGVPETGPVPAARPEAMPSVTPGAANTTKNAVQAQTGVGVSTPAGTAEAAKGITPGAGLANLAGAAGKAAVDYSGLSGKGRNTAPEQGFMDKVSAAAQQVLGPEAQLDVTSGTYSPEKTAAINEARAAAASKPGATAQSIAAAGKAAGQIGSTRHTTAKAVDFSISVAGKPATREQMQDVAAQFTKDNPTAGIGIGKGYMDKDGIARAHVDLSGLGKSWATSTAMKETLDAARAGYNPTPFSNPGVPTSRPTPTAAELAGIETPAEVDRNYADQGNLTAPEVDRNYAEQARSTAFSPEVDRNYAGQGFAQTPNTAPTPGYKPDLDPTQHKSVFDSIAPSQQATAAAIGPTTNDKLGTSPAARAAMGLTPRSPEEKSAMAQAIAGELSPKSLDNLSKNDPAARAEFAAMVASMENRAQSKTYTGVAATLSPTQYNSLMDANMSTTKQNYSKYSAVLDKAMDDFYSGKMPENLDKTSYYNPDISDPSWGPMMTDPTKIGEHIFGSLPEYGPDAAAQKAAAAMSLMAGTNYSPGKAKDDHVGTYAGGGTGTTHGGSPGQSGGAGYSPGGMNSPSGSSAAGGSGNYGPSGNSSTGGGSGYGGGVAGGGTASGGSAGMSGGGGFSPGGMGSPSGSTASSPSSGGSNRGLGGPTSNNSGMSGGNKAGGSVGKGGGFASSAPSGASGGL
jgi:spore germination cell wall hydrolase CwlJ-like protein